MEPAKKVRLNGDVEGFSQHFGDRLGGERRLLRDGSIVETRFLPDSLNRVLIWGKGWAWVERSRLEVVELSAGEKVWGWLNRAWGWCLRRLFRGGSRAQLRRKKI